jgi:hypothetical protein
LPFAKQAERTFMAYLPIAAGVGLDLAQKRRTEQDREQSHKLCEIGENVDKVSGALCVVEDAQCWFQGAVTQGKS